MRKRILRLALMSLVAAALLTGCSFGAENGKNAAEYSENADTQEAETQATDTWATETQTAETKETDTSATESQAAFPRELTEKELEDYSEYLNGRDAYGFLLSSYDDVRNVNLAEVFYSGAGIDVQPDAAETKEYLKAVGQDELFTDLICIPAESLNQVLSDRTGYSLKDMQEAGNDISMTYIKEYDAYFHEVGDTNYIQSVCISGTENVDGTVTLECEAYMGEGTDYDVIVNKCTVTLDKATRHFISNEITDGFYK
jgi:hypothetical protein